MLDGLFMLLSLSMLMAIASFLAGSLPLSFSLSQTQLRVISTVGMGVLVGTSLIVIIPEGVETLYSAGQPAHSHAKRAIFPMPLDIRWHGRRTIPLQDEPMSALIIPAKRHVTVGSDAIPALPGPVIPSDGAINTEADDDPPRTPTKSGEVHVLEEPKSPAIGSDVSLRSHHTPHAWIGISLILGFILMYLIDMIPSLAPAQPSQRTHNIYSLSDLSSTSSPPSSTPSLPKGTLSTTLGLVIHATADGIALGASSSQPSLSFIIFVAIMVHKAPAAFGLTSVLLKQGLGKRAARAHLLVFSLAAPIGALGTWFVVRILGGAGNGPEAEESMKWWTGVLLLFSGGTFLYVAMHTMQDDDIANGFGHEDSNANGYLDVSHGRDPPRQKPARSLRLVLAAVAGMLLPLLTQIGDAH